MPRKFAVEKLESEQFDFIIRKILDGLTDREICAEVMRRFDVEIAHSSLNRWRNKAGDELAERYRLKRFQVSSFVERLKDEGIEVSDNKYKVIIDNLEDHLLTSERDLIAANPVKLLFARQEDERLRIKREELEFKREQLAFDREKHKNTIDRVKVGAETLQDFIEYADGDVEIITVLTRHLKPFGEFLKTKYAGSES